MNRIFTNIIILDSLPKDLELPPSTLAFLIDSFEENENTISVPKFIESNDSSLKSEYFQHINNLCYKNIDIFKSLQVDDRLNLWECSPLLEGSIYSAQIGQAIKMLAIYQLLRVFKPNTIEITSSYSSIILCIDNYCKKNQILFKSSLNKKVNIVQNLKQKIKRSTLFLFSTSVAYLLLHFFQWLLIKNSGSHEMFYEEADIFFAPMAHLSTTSMKSWEGLDNVFNELDKKANFVYLFSKTAEVSTPKAAIKKLNSFKNSKAVKNILLELFLTNSTYLEALLLHFKSLKAYLNLDKKKLFDNLSMKGESLLPILKDTIKKSFFGPAFTDNLIRFLNIKILFKNIESPLRCFYLYENQSWEKVVNSEFKNISPSQKTIGVLHSTVRFWDLRFAQPNYIDRPHSDLLYNPDYFAINGSEAMSQYKNAGFDSDRLLEVESLRYSYLIDIPQNSQKDISDLELEEISILVFGDYSPILNNKMIIFLEHCDKIISNPIKFIFKSHINAPINISRYTFRNAVLTKEINENLFANYKNCFFSNMTSAQVDAIYFNIDPMIYVDASELNLSPLRKHENANFIFTPNDLLQACLSGNSSKGQLKPNSKNFLFLDKDLKKWKSLISTKL